MSLPREVWSRFASGCCAIDQVNTSCAAGEVEASLNAKKDGPYRDKRSYPYSIIRLETAVNP